MKKLILLAILATQFLNAQPYISLQLDGKNAIVGSAGTENKPEIDLLFKMGVLGNKGFKVGLIYENFKAIDFNKYCVDLGQRIPVTESLLLIPSLEAGWIERYKLNTWTIGANIECIYMINDNLGISATTNLSARTDLDYLYGGNNWNFSNYVGVIWIFDKYKKW
jgi:hypothetical protein